MSTTSFSDDLHAKRHQLLALLGECGRVAIAFSAGVDSTVVAKAAHLACGENAVAVTASSASLATGELDEAMRLARLIGIRHRIIETSEFADPNYLSNPANRCFFCKSELYSQLDRILPELNVDVVVNGANLDDRGDHRPGMTAAAEHSVRSPLIEAGLTKQDVRDLARHWDLPVWDKPAMPCLSSRIAYGVEVTSERVRRIDLAEQFLAELLGTRELRVRLEAGDLARIEVPLERIAELVEPESREKIATELKRLGFRFVTLDLEGFRSGSLNAILPRESLSIPMNLASDRGESAD
jgi:uncharacterized protein